REEQEDAIRQLAALDTVTAHQAASQAVETLTVPGTAEDKRMAAEYLATIPVTTRSALIPDPDTGRLVPVRSATLAERVLLRLLPINAPPFPVGTVLPGTPYRLEAVLGSGGFGVVYRASNTFEQLTPPRAIKFCLNPGMLATLHRERALLDRLM